jgi:hypothetical protein
MACLWGGDAAALAGGPIALSHSGRALSAIEIAPNASASERYAALVLKSHLDQITGAQFAMHTDGRRDKSQPIIAVGPGAASSVAPDLDLTPASLGDEGIIVSRITDNQYHLYRIGALPLGQSNIVWIAPKGNKQIKRILVGRLLVIRGNVTLDSSRVR